MIPQPNDERGLAMVTGIMISVVVLFFSIAVVQLSFHNSNSSARDRKRVDAISTAEAGIDATMSTVQSAIIDKSQGLYTLPCSVQGALPEAPQAKYTVDVNYYANYPPSGDPMTCPPETAPAAATFSSTGEVGVSSVAVSRTMQAQARLSPIYGSFGHAIFSNQDLNLENHLGVNGNQGNDGDIYTNGNFSCSNNSNIAGSIFAQGTIALSSSCTFAQDAYGKLGVTMLNSALVGHDVISATLSLTMLNNTRINHNVTVASATCSGCTTGPGGRIGGTVTTGHVSPAPPPHLMPQIDFADADWHPPYQILPFSSCTAARAAILTGWATPTVVRIQPACTLTFSADTVAMRQNLAIVSDGPITFSQHNQVKSADGGKYIFFMIEPTNGIENPNCVTTPRDISVSNQTEFTGVYIFAYSQCTITFANNNAGLGGQIIGGKVDIQNLYDFKFVPIIIPKAVISGFKEDLAFIREVVNP